MSQLRDLISGHGSLDTAVRALSLAMFVLVTVALVWTTVSLRSHASALTTETRDWRVSVQTGETFEDSACLLGRILPDGSMTTSHVFVRDSTLVSNLGAPRLRSLTRVKDESRSLDLRCACDPFGA